MGTWRGLSQAQMGQQSPCWTFIVISGGSLNCVKVTEKVSSSYLLLECEMNTCPQLKVKTWLHHINMALCTVVS